MVVAVEITLDDRRTVEEFEAAVVGFDEVVAVRRLFGTPDYLVQVPIGDADGFEAFSLSELIGPPAVARATPPDPEAPEGLTARGSRPTLREQWARSPCAGPATRPRVPPAWGMGTTPVT